MFAIFFLHATIVFSLLWLGPRIFGGGVADRHVWEKVVATKVGRCRLTRQTTQYSSLNPVNLPNLRH